MIIAPIAFLACALAGCGQAPEAYDVVLQAGRVIDPETGLDAIRDVGIRGNAIAQVAEGSLVGSRTIDARGLVVAPGFIDLHQHQQDGETYDLAAFSGVTSNLELEAGVPDVNQFVNLRRGQTRTHFGAAASHWAARMAAWDLPLPASVMGPGAMTPPPATGPATAEPASPERLQRILALLRTQLAAGALGIGMGLEYTPGATRHEVIEVFRLAAEYRRPVFVHARSAGPLEPGSAIESLTELIGAAAVTGAAVHVVHVNSTCMMQSPECLRMIEGARVRGLDVTTESYPYGAGATFINSAFFNPGWRERRGINYGDVEVPETGERLTEARFNALRSEQRVVLIHLNSDDVVDAVVRHQDVMIASDGGRAHPRNTGTFARVLARYVRGDRSLSLEEAIRKMSLLPAIRLEMSTQDARRKGRIQVGADADVVVFDLEAIQDNATFREPLKASSGVRYLLVSGDLVIDNGRITLSRPGLALLGGSAGARVR